MDTVYCEIDNVDESIVSAVRNGLVAAIVHTPNMGKYNTGHIVARRTTRKYSFVDGKLEHEDVSSIQMRDGKSWKNLTNNLAELFDPEEYDRRIKRKAENKRSAEKHSYQVGDIFVSGWGYEQTNVEFYQVVKATKCTVTVREICSKREYDGYMTGTATPIKDAFVSGYSFIDDNAVGKTCRVGKYGDIKITSDGVIYASPWNGKPAYFSRTY